MESECRAMIRVTGRVQGVGYRYAALQRARLLGLTGYVKNLPEGAVYIEAQGNPDAVGILIDWCRVGPRNAVVESVEFCYIPLAESSHFQIR